MVFKLDLQIEKIWDMREHDIKDDREIINKDNSENVENVRRDNIPKAGKEIESGYVPISYSTLEDTYNLKILSEKRSGMENRGEVFESKYSFCNKDIKLDLMDKKVFDKTVITSKPTFLKLYAKKRDGDLSSVILVKDRFGKRIVIDRKIVKINM